MAYAIRQHALAYVQAKGYGERPEEGSDASDEKEGHVEPGGFHEEGV